MKKVEKLKTNLNLSCKNKLEKVLEKE